MTRLVLGTVLPRQPASKLQPLALTLTRFNRCHFAQQSPNNSTRLLQKIKRETQESNIERICIDMASLNNPHKLEAITNVLDKVYQGQFSPSVIVH
jgi:hypothetical protein